MSETYSDPSTPVAADPGINLYREVHKGIRHAFFSSALLRRPRR